MKNLLSILFFTAFIQQIFSQACTVTATAPRDTIVCGDRISLSAFGQGQGVAVLTEAFNGGTYGPGWQSTQQATWNNPCSPSGVDGTTHIWMGSSSPVPRILATAPFNFLSCATAGVTICFDMLFATQGNTAPCEGPDEPQEGVYLQYSINGTIWTDIHYFDPNGGSDPQLINWNNWCFPVPAAAITSTTRFRFFQDADSGADYDHWGVDNVAIYCNDPTFNIVWQHDGYSSGAVGGVNPTPVAPNVTTNYIVTMSNGTVTCRDTISIAVKNPIVIVNAGTDTTICAGQCARLNGTAKVIVSPAKTPTYSNNELTQITTGFGAVSDIGINITDLNMTNVLPNSITQVCINNVFFFGANIFPPSQVDISDLILTLTCPSGQVITLVPANVTTGGSNPLTGGYNNTCFVPSGGANIASGTAPYSGSFAPSQPFSNLNGCNANGVWVLGVQMNSAIGFGTGTFSGWNISFIDPEIAYTGNYNWTPTTNMTNSTTLQPTVCPTLNSIYTLTVSDTAGCVTRTDAVNVNIQAVCCSLSATATRTQPTCGASNGAIDLTPAPTGTYTYTWSDGAITTQDRTGLAAGTYSVTITNSANPTCTFDTTIILNSNSSLTASITKVDPTCAGGGTNGSATLTISGGTAPFTITIDTGGTPFTITVPFNPGPQTIGSQDAGTVTVSITDAASCTATATTTLIAPVCCSLTATSTATQPTCGASNGAINVTPQPAGTYTYAWSDGAVTTQNRTGLAAGTYNVTITTASNTTCTFTTTVLLNSNSSLTASITKVDPTCAGGGTNGSATLTITGGTAPFTITIDTGGTPFTITAPFNPGPQTIGSQDAGTVTVSITDAATCSATATTTLIAPVCCSLTATTTTTQPTCGASNGAINVTPQPAGTYTYAWSDGAVTTQNRTGLAAATYSVTITNSANPTCTFDTSIILNSNSSLSVAISTVNPTCAGGAANGSATLTITGGTAPFVITVDTGGTPFTIALPFNPGPQTIGSLSAGAVSVSIVDAATCSASASANLVAPNCCTFTVSAVLTQPGCAQTNGSIVLTATNGSGNYTYNWANGSGTGNTASSLGAGIYDVTITDAGFANCAIDTSFSLNSNSTLALTFNNQINPTCAGNDGSINVTFSGGTAPYNVVVDTNGVQAISIPSPITVTNQNVPNLPAGSIIAVVTDANSCVATATATLISPVCCNLLASANVTPGSCGLANASITAVVISGGTAPYTYSLDGINYQNQPLFSNVSAGNYAVISTDVNGCSDTILSIVPVSSNNLNVVLAPINSTCFGTNDGQITASQTGGNSPFAYSWNNTETTATISGLTPGTYNVSVTDQTGCTGSASTTVTEPASLTISLGNDTVACEGTNIIISAGNGFTSYAWSSSESTASITPTTSGIYSVTVTDSNFCTASDVINVTLVTAPIIDLGTDKLVYEGSPVGLFSTILSGDDKGTYNWLPDTLLNCSTCQNVVANAYDTITYQVVYTDPTGCSVTDAITIYTLPVGEVYFPNAFTPNGDGNNDFYLPFGSGVKQVKWQLFNRWGEKVFESNNFNYGCDGTYKGAPLPMGVYVYYAEITLMNNDSRKLKGSMTLIR